MVEQGLPWGGATILTDDTQVHRAVLRERWLRGGIRYNVFIRRPSDTDGLSVSNPLACTPQQLCATFRECYGVLTLEVGAVRGVGLDVVPDIVPGPDVPCDHANIVGLPFQSEDPARAEFLATKLVGIVREVWHI